jgi:transcription elongation factor GreA
MSPKIELSKSTHEYLVNHLPQLNEQKMALLNDISSTYAPGAPVDDSAEISNFLDHYAHTVQSLLDQAEVLDDEHKPLPMTFIGCDIKVREVDSNQTHVFRVVSPYETRPTAGHISYLSPLGRNLLLKKPGETLEVKAPGGTVRYAILSVDHPRS